MRVTSEMLARYERECEKRDAEKQMEAGVHTAAAATLTSPTTSAASVTPAASTTTAPDDAETVDNEKHAAVEDSAAVDEDAMDDGILEELTIPGIVINIGEINFGEANINIHNAEHYESSTWMRDSACDDSCVPDDGDYYDSDDGVADDDETGEGGSGGCGGDETDAGGDVGTTSAVLSTEQHSVEVDQGDMKDAISHILKIDRRTVEKVFLGVRLYLDALAEVLDEMGEPADGLGDHSADSHGTDSHRCKGCRFIRTTPKSRIAAHHV